MTARKYQITGVGPVSDADGSVDIYTVEPQPFHVTKEWLAAQSKAPEVGDDIVDDVEGGLTLESQQQAEAEEAAHDDAKKADGASEPGSETSATGSAASLGADTQTADTSAPKAQGVSEASEQQVDEVAHHETRLARIERLLQSLGHDLTEF